MRARRNPDDPIRGLSNLTLGDVERWDFYVLPTSLVDERWGEQKSVGLAQIRAATAPVPFAGLRQRIEEILGFSIADGL